MRFLAILATVVVAVSAQRCGPDFGNAACPAGNCCSQWGWCGTSVDHCVNQCASQCTGGTTTTTSTTTTSTSTSTSTTTTTTSTSTSTSTPIPTGGLQPRNDFRCGPEVDNAPCFEGYCCSEWGWCGTAGHCTSNCAYQCDGQIPDPGTTTTTSTSTTTTSTSTTTTPTPTPTGSLPFRDSSLGYVTRCRTPGTAAITYDDGPNSSITPQLLDEAAAEGVKLTFFWLGSLMQSNQALVQRAYNEGHQIALHSFDHPDMAGLSGSALSFQVNEPNNVLQSIVGQRAAMFRTPYGSTSAAVEQAIEDGGMENILWNLDTNDWRHRDPAQVIGTWQNEVSTNTSSNSYIGLAHDINTANPGTIDDIVAILRSRGYTITTVAECTGLPAYQ